METWRFRIMVATALVILIFGDFFGLGMGKDRKMPIARQSPTLRDDHPTIYLEDEGIGRENDSSADLLSVGGGASSPDAAAAPTKVIKLTDKLRDECLPKMLCEMATKSPTQLSEKEAQLLEMIRASTLTQTFQGTKWHFAAHMGQLMRYSVDTNGCSTLWPHCPFTSKRLNEMSVKLVLK